MLEEFHIVKGRYTTFNPEKYIKAVLNTELQTKIAKMVMATASKLEMEILQTR